MATWRSYPQMAAGDVVDSDLIPFSDESQLLLARSRTISVASLRQALDGGLLPIVSYAGAHTLDETDDLGHEIRVTAAGAVTIPPDLPVGWWCTLENATESATVSIAAGSGVTILSVGDEITNGKVVAVVMVNTNVARVVGAFADDPALAPADLGDLDDVDTTGAATGDVLAFDGTDWVPVDLGDVDGASVGSGAATDGFVLTADGAGGSAWEAVAGAGDVTGPASAVDERIAVFDGTTGKLLKDGGVAVAGLATAAQGALADSAVQPGDPVTFNAQTGTSYTFALGDEEDFNTFENAAAVAVTIPTNAAVAFAVGTVLVCGQKGAGLVTCTGGTGVTVNGTSAGSVDSAGQWSTWTLTQTATNVWWASGGLA